MDYNEGRKCYYTKVSQKMVAVQEVVNLNEGQEAGIGVEIESKSIVINNNSCKNSLILISIFMNAKIFSRKLNLSISNASKVLHGSGDVRLCSSNCLGKSYNFGPGSVDTRIDPVLTPDGQIIGFLIVYTITEDRLLNIIQDGFSNGIAQRAGTEVGNCLSTGGSLANCESVSCPDDDDDDTLPECGLRCWCKRGSIWESITKDPCTDRIPPPK